MSSLQALSGFKLKKHFVQNIIKDYTHLTNSGKTIILCWIPSHVNVVGNDTAAKSALSLPITNMKLRAGELLLQGSKFCLNEWQEIWDCRESNKLYSVYTTVGSVAHSKNMSCYDSVLINRLRIGHSRLTHWHTDPPTCQLCGLAVSIKKHLRRMCQLAGHWYKIFYSLFCFGAVSKCRQ